MSDFINNAATAGSLLNSRTKYIPSTTGPHYQSIASAFCYADPPKESTTKVVYECFKPQTLEETKEYVNFMLSSRSIIANKVEELDSESDEAEPAIPWRADFNPEQVLQDNFSLKEYFEDYSANNKGILHISKSIGRP